jgi:hypothetical protein
VNVAEVLFKTVVYLGCDDDCGVSECHGTGFCASIASAHGGKYVCVITAKHVAVKLENARNVFVEGSGADRKPQRISIPEGARWWYHAMEGDSVDAAVLPMPNLPTDIATIPPELFLSVGDLDKKHIGPGDETFTAGLFLRLEDYALHLPLVRHGHLALAPPGKVVPIEITPGNRVHAEGYLIESHSIGGISGSPVFVRETVQMDGQVADGTFVKAQFYGRMYLLGVFQGHWTIKPGEINHPYTHPGELPQGLAFVVPAHKVLEIINRLELASIRERREDERGREQRP